MHLSETERTIGSSGILLCPTPEPSTPWSGPIAPAPSLNVFCPFDCQVMYPSDGLSGFAQYSKPATRTFVSVYEIRVKEKQEREQEKEK